MLKDDTSEEQRNCIALMYHHLPLDAAEPRLELEVCQADNIMAVEASFVADDVNDVNHDNVDRLAALITNQQAATSKLA